MGLHAHTPASRQPDLIRAASRMLALVAVAAVAITPGAGVAAAQTTLTLADAMARARAMTPDARMLAAAQDEATERVRQARAGYLPRVEATEAVQRGNQPVFVFGSLLSQRRFTADHFAIDALNHPDPITNVRTSVGVEQSIFDGGATRLAVRGAELGRALAEAGRAGGEADLALGAAQAFIGVLQLEASMRATDAAVAAAESDRQRARARRDAGLATEADVLAVEVHLADARQRQASLQADREVARMRLALATGLPIDTPLTLVMPSAPPAPASTPASTDALVGEATAGRPELRQASLQQQLAETARRAAQAAFLPRVGVQAGWEFNGTGLTDQRASWVAGGEVRLNLFNGFADKARLAEARHAELRAAAERERVAQAVDLDVRAAVARLDAARARDAVGRAALEQARAAQRIVRDRYDSGLATITDVLRAADAAFDAESRATASALDVVVQGVALDRALGRL